MDMTDEEAAEKYARDYFDDENQGIGKQTYLAGAAHGRRAEREEILGMLRSFECLDGKRADAKSAFQLADWLESELNKKEGRKG